MKKRKNSRVKGNRGQNDVAKLLAPWWGEEFASTPQSGGFATTRFRNDWNAAGDIVTPDNGFPFCVEVKHAEGWELEQLIKSDKCDPWAWWNQCVEETPPGKIPLLVFRRNYRSWHYMMYVHDWMGEYPDLVYVPGRNMSIHVPPNDPLYNFKRYVIVGLFSDFLQSSKEEWLAWGMNETPKGKLRVINE